MSPKSLLYYSQFKIYYLLYNTIELVQRMAFVTVFAMKPPVVKKKIELNK